MPRITVDAKLREQLANLVEASELCDEAGNVLGTFKPKIDPSKRPELQPQISDEELERRRREPGGRPLKDILDDWRKGA